MAALFIDVVVDAAIAKGIGFTTCPVSNSFVTDQMKSDEIVSLLARIGGLPLVEAAEEPPLAALALMRASQSGGGAFARHRD